MAWAPDILPAMGDVTPTSQQDSGVILHSQTGVGQRAGAVGRCIAGATTQVFSLGTSRLHLSSRERIHAQPV